MLNTKQNNHPRVIDVEWSSRLLYSHFPYKHCPICGAHILRYMWNPQTAEGKVNWACSSSSLKYVRHLVWLNRMTRKI